MKQVGWGIRFHPTARCQWYLIPCVFNAQGDMVNQPTDDRWVPVYVETTDDDDDRE